MDDYFIHILRLTSYIKQHLIRYVEGFLFGDCERLSHDPQISLSRYDEGSIGSKSNSPHGDCSMGRHSVDITKHEDLSLNEGSKTSVVRRARILICQGLMLPLHGLRLGLRLASACVRYSCLYVRSIQKEVSGFLCRVRRTLLGSSKEIGWLQRTEGLPPVVDGTNRFMEVLHDVRSGKHRLPDSLVYLLIPGLFSNHSPLYFVNTKRFFSKMGLTSHIAKIHSESSVEKNAWELKQYIEELFWGSGKKVLLLGHSKGGVDAAAALSMYWSDLKDKVAGLALVQSPYGGSPIAADILREGQIADKEARKIMEFIVCKLIKVKGKTSSSSSKTVTKTTTVKVKAEKKVYTLPGQKHDPPEEREPLRIFYESLSNQIPTSEMAEFWMMEHGLLSPERAKKAYERKQKRQHQIRTGTPIKSLKQERPESSNKPQFSKNGDTKPKKRSNYSDEDDDDFIAKRKKSKLY